MKTVLLLISGAGILALFIYTIILSLNENASRFFKFLLAYLLFFVIIGILFYLFSEAWFIVALLAGVGWIILIVKGAANSQNNSRESRDNPDNRSI
jgi:hypothetical protein